MTDTANLKRSATPGAQARHLMRAADRATLASGQHDAAGWPYASLVLCAADHDGSPILLLSDLAEHTKNVADDARVSLLFDGTAGLDDPLTGARATVLGTLSQDMGDRLRRRFLARHPSAAGYADFADFHFYRLETERAHLVAGFGAIDWIENGDLLFDATDARPLIDAEAGVVEHMNEDHADALDAYAQGLLGLSGSDWVMTGIDPEGLDMRRGGAVARLDFDTPITDAQSARKSLVALVHDARAKLADNQTEAKQ